MQVKYIVERKLATTGLIIASISGFCPFLRVPIVGNWNIFQSDIRLAMITYAVLGLCAMTLIVGNAKAFRLTAVLSFIWFLLAVVATWFTANHYFGWKFASHLLSRTIHFQWGWLVLLAGILLMLLSIRKSKVNE